MPTFILLGILAGWLNRQQQAVIEYLQTENEILKRQLGRRRLRLSDDDRRRLAVKGKALGRKVLHALGCIVTPDTILAWHRRLIALKWIFPRRQKIGSLNGGYQVFGSLEDSNSYYSYSPDEKHRIVQATITLDLNKTGLRLEAGGVGQYSYGGLPGGINRTTQKLGLPAVRPNPHAETSRVSCALSQSTRKRCGAE